MRFEFKALTIIVSTWLVLLSSPLLLRAQILDPAMLLNPPPDTWPTYHGDYSGKRHSSLTQITPQNVGGLTLEWAFQTNQNAIIKSSPLLVDGILYFTVPDNVWAVDARSGHIDLALHLPAQQGPPHRSSRRRHV